MKGTPIKTFKLRFTLCIINGLLTRQIAKRTQNAFLMKYVLNLDMFSKTAIRFITLQSSITSIDGKQ